MFEVEDEDVKTSVDTTVDLDDKAPEHRDCDDKALHIDLSGENEEILLDEEVVTDILDQDTESEETETKDTSDVLRTSPSFYQERVMPADQDG